MSGGYTVNYPVQQEPADHERNIGAKRQQQLIAIVKRAARHRNSGPNPRFSEQDLYDERGLPR